MDRFLSILLALSFSLGHLGRISLFNQQVNFYLYELLTLVVVFILFIIKGWNYFLNRLKKNSLIGLILGYFFISFFLDIKNYSLNENLISFLYFLRLVFYFLIYVYLKINFEVFIISLSGLIFIISLTQYFFYPDLRNLLYLGWDPHLYRMFGSYFDPYVATAIYNLIFFIFLFNKNLKFRRFFLISYFIFIFLTFSRFGISSFLITLVIYLLKNKQFKKIVFLMICSVLLLLYIPKPFGEGVNLLRFFSIESRLMDYKQGLSFWLKKPVFGYGYNRIRYLKNDLISHSGASFHSSYLMILVTGGFVGFFLVSYGFYKYLKEIKDKKTFFYFLFVSLYSLADNVFLHPFILFLLVLVIKSEKNFFINPSQKRP